jgi:hypothetical protein
MSQPGEPAIPPAMEELGRVFVENLELILGDNLYSVTFYGAAVFPETLPTGDVDFHVILRRALIGDDRSALEEMHRQLALDYPPLGGEMDGYYIRLDDVRKNEPPYSQLWQKARDNAWALHCAHIRAGRCVVLHGPPPEEIYAEPSWNEVESALYDELAYVERHLEKYPDYCILNTCRLIYSFETRQVVISKAWAAGWAWERYPEWRPHIEAAKRSYAREATAADEQLMATGARAYYDFAVGQIRLSQARWLDQE